MGCPVSFAKIFRFPADPNQIYIHRRLVPNEGRIAIVTDAGWDAVDAAASGVRWVVGRIDLRERTLSTRRRRRCFFFYAFAEASARHAALELEVSVRACRVEALAKTGGSPRTVKSCGPGAWKLAPSLAEARSAQPGRIKPSICKATEAREHHSPRRSRISRKPFACGNAG